MAVRPLKSFASADLSLADAAHMATIGLFVVACIYSFFFAEAVLLPILLAALISIVLRPVVWGLRKVGVPEGLAAAMVILVLVTGVFFGLNRLVEPARGWIAQAPAALQELQREFGEVSETLESARKVTAELENMTEDGSASNDESVTVRGPTLLEQSMSYTWTTVTQVTLMLVLLYFFLALGPRTLDGTLLLLPLETQRQYCRDLIAAVQGQLGSYLRSLTLIYLVLGALTALAMLVLDMPNPLLWGMMAFVLGFLPFIGPVLTTTAIAMVALTTFDGLTQILLPPLVYAAMTLVEGFFITPNIIGRTMTVSPFAVFVSIVFWGWIWGFPGAVLAVPILASIKIIIDHAAGLRSVEQVAGEFAVKPESAPEVDGEPTVPQADNV